MAKKREKRNTKSFSCCSPNFLGWFFVILGAYFFFQGLGFIQRSFPFWSLLVVLLGVYLLMKNPRKR